MRTPRLGLVAILLAASAAATSWLPRAYAVDTPEIKVENRWSVVGIIAGGEEKGRPVGIAVLKNNDTKRTYTLSIGDDVPNEFGYTLQSVKGRSVIISDGKEKVSLGFAEGSSDDADTPQNRTARFIDNYYRGLGEMPPADVFSAAGDADEGGSTITNQAESSQTLRLPLRRFGSLKEEAPHSRFDAYRDSRSYRDDDGDQGGAVGSESGDYQARYDYDEVPSDAVPYDGQADADGQPSDQGYDTYDGY
jgi:hypothetical protein